MSEVIIRCRLNGPLLVEGPIKVVDHEGREFQLKAGKPAVALCRCGQSAKRPFCDGTHNRCGFQAAETAPTA
jgi:CDGSH-type Zn-finger protein